MKTRKFKIVLAILAFAVVAMAGEVTIPGTKILITPPDGWTVNNSPGPGNLILISSPPIQEFKSTISLSTDPLGGKSEQAWLSDYKTGLKQHIQDFELAKEANMKLNDMDFVVLSFNGMVGKVMLSWIQAIHFREGKAYIFSGMTRLRHRDMYEKKFQKSFSSIYFPPLPPQLVGQALSETEVLLTWTPVERAKGGYELQRLATMGGMWETIATTPEGTATHTDMAVDCGTDVMYRVKALNPKGDSEWSNEITVALDSCPVATDEMPIENEPEPEDE